MKHLTALLALVTLLFASGCKKECYQCHIPSNPPADFSVCPGDKEYQNLQKWKSDLTEYCIYGD